MTSRRRGKAPLAIAGGVALGVLAWGSTATEGSFTTARTTNSTDTSQTGQVRGSHAYASMTCSGGGPSSTACAGSPAPVGPSSSTAQSTTDLFTNQSTVTGTATHQVRVVSCAPAQFADSVGGNSDPLFPRFNVGRQVVGPWGAGTAARFDGVDDYAADVVPTTTSDVASASYSLGIWFKAASGTAAGGLLSLNASPLDSGTLGANPSLYLGTAGQVRFKADGLLGIPVRLASGVDHRDGLWHLAVVTVERGGRFTLYVDGVARDSTTNVTLSGTSSASYWHVGWTDTTGLLTSPPSRFAGDLAGAFQSSVVLTSAQVAALGSAPSPSAYASAVPSPVHVWLLGEDVTSTFGGSVGFITGGKPCAMVRLGWNLGSTTAFAPTALSALADGSWRPATPATAPAVGAAQTLTSSYSRITTGYDTDTVGLELLTPLEHRLAIGSWMAPFRWGRVVFLG